MKQHHTVFTVPLLLLLLFFLPLNEDVSERSVTGTLVNQVDDPLAEHVVRLFDANDEQLAVDTTGADGSFTLIYEFVATSAGPEMSPETPAEFRLGSSYPNPFNPHTTIPFHVPEATRATFTLYNLLGQRIMQSSGDVDSGIHEIHVSLGGDLAQGQYLLHVTGDGFALTETMTFVSAGRSGTNPGIRVRSGSRQSGSPQHALRRSGGTESMAGIVTEEDQIRLVVEEKDWYVEEEQMVPFGEDHDTGPVTVPFVEGIVEILSGHVNDALYQTDDGFDGRGIHGGMAWEVCPSNWVFGSVMGGEAHKGSEQGDQPDINDLGAIAMTPENPYLNAKWTARFEGIHRANLLLRVLPLAEEGYTQEELSELEGFARFVRGHFYFELRRTFNMVPVYDEHTGPSDLPDNYDDIWSFIEGDFEVAMNLLPEVPDNPEQPNRWAAASYLAKTYIYQEKWSETGAMLDEIIDNGRTSGGLEYDLVPLDEIHNPADKNHAETVFAIQTRADDDFMYANAGMMLNYPHGNSSFACCGFFQPSQYLVNAFQTEDGLPLLDNHLATEVTWDQGLTSSEQFDPHDGPLDPRLDWTVGRRGVPFHDWGPHPGSMWIRDQAYSGPYASKKHIWWQRDDDEVHNATAWAPGSSYNIPIIRFADILLMAAEAAVELDNLEKARQYVNRVRERAADSDAWVNDDFNRDYAYDIVDSESDMLALSPDAGAWVVREDLGTTWVFLGGDSGQIGNWNEYPDPADQYEIATYESGDFGSQNEARDIVRFERLLELALEGHRFFDLNRWNAGEEKLNEFFNYEGGLFPASYVADGWFYDHNRYLPIPQAQMDENPNLIQNPGY